MCRWVRIVVWATPLGVFVVCVLARIVLGPVCISTDCAAGTELASNVVAWALIALAVWFVAMVVYGVWRLFARIGRRG
jgi:hypothetical protein